ncbi:MAG: DUF3180 domain-containing protein [Demequina sp.]
MTPLTWRWLALTWGVVLVLTWVGTRAWMGAGASPTQVPWTVAAVCVGAAVMALVWAWSVRQYVKGERPGLSALKAARIAVFAQSCALGGAVLTGLFGGYALAWVDQWGHAPRREAAMAALVAAVGGLVMWIAGMVSERWCRSNIDGDDDEDPPMEAV